MSCNLQVALDGCDGQLFFYYTKSGLTSKTYHLQEEAIDLVPYSCFLNPPLAILSSLPLYLRVMLYFSWNWTISLPEGEIYQRGRKSRKQHALNTIPI